MNYRVSCLIFLFLILAMNMAFANDLQWLSGGWVGKNSEGQKVSLILSKMHEDRILGSETVYKKMKAMKISSFEHFEIRKKNGVYELEVFPRGQKSLVMKATKVTKRQLTFANPKHDFPKFWSFELKADGSLVETAKSDSTEIKIIFKSAM